MSLLPAHPAPPRPARSRRSSLYLKGTTTHTYVTYQVEDAQGEVLSAWPVTACFSGVSYSALAPEAARIVVTHRLNRVPYSRATIARWIKEMNLNGFPCTLRPLTWRSQSYRITLDLASYAKKAHLTHALQLIRALNETGICRVPEVYLRLLHEAGPKVSPERRFTILQQAHQEICDQAYCNTNHTVLNGTKGDPTISRSTYEDRIRRAQHGVRSSSYPTYQTFWDA